MGSPLLRAAVLRSALFGSALLWGVLAGAVAGAPSVDARESMLRNFAASKVSGFNGSVSMVLTNDKGQERVRKLAMWSKLKSGGTDSEVRMRFEAPADVKGTGFLQIENSRADDDIWVYLPALGKTRRLVSSNKRDSFFGTDFSYGDVLLPPVEEYEHRYLRNEVLDGADCIVIESKPIDARVRDESGYSRKLIWLDAGSHVERQVQYHDLGGALLKTQRTFDIQAVEPERQRWMPMRREMTNHQTSHKTVYKFDRFALDPKISEALFTTRGLEE